MCTVFVPSDCQCDCPFCNTKKLYADFKPDPKYIYDQCKTILALNHQRAIKEYVVTGGEPAIDIDALKMLVGVMERRVFINTNFFDSNREEFTEFINRNDKIRGVNISRHLEMLATYDLTNDVEVLDTIDKPVRINTIIRPDKLDDREYTERIQELIKMYSSDYRMINFRADYTTVTEDNLKTEDPVCRGMRMSYRWLGSNQCLVCNSEFYRDDRTGHAFCYHRGLEHSSVVYGDRCYVNDVILDMCGYIYRDWDMVPDSGFKEALANEKFE